ncbi:hypothetical protein OSK59_09330, partial [Escherichia coli]|nr:hypothetical protein [Escherichia coli]
QPPAHLTSCTAFRAQKNPHKAGSFRCPCLLFASRYSFAKRSWIETVYWQKIKTFYKQKQSTEQKRK